VIIPTVAASPRTVTFTAPCPECGRYVAWSQEFSSYVLPAHFTITCPCTESSRGPSHAVIHP
jgi:hypothetical protein